MEGLYTRLADLKALGVSADQNLKALGLEQVVQLPAQALIALVDVAKAALDVRERQVPDNPSDARRSLGGRQRLHLSQPLKDLNIALGGKS